MHWLPDGNWSECATLEHRCADATGLFVDIPQACPEMAVSEFLNVSGLSISWRMGRSMRLLLLTRCNEYWHGARGSPNYGISTTSH